ncbi:MAG: T9SS C-terminal target domain-containing protein [Chitinophagia bacterium]|nr:T9SS C-terminal target domain-containing protein [Chitinophagia bacterium]
MLMRFQHSFRPFTHALVAVLLLLANGNKINAQCSATSAPTYTSFCSNQYFSAITASGTGVTSTISVSGGTCASGSTSGAGYTYFNNFTSMGVAVPPGGMFNLNLTRGSAVSTAYVTTYIDWNSNNTYETTEMAGSTQTWNPGTSTMTYSIVVPFTGIAVSTNLHMRVMLSQASTGAPCTADWGQTYDFYCVINNCSAPSITVSPTSTSICNNGSGVVLIGAGAGTGGSYQWSPATGLATTNTASVIATPTVTTVYTVRGYNSAGCPDTAITTVIVNPMPASISGAAYVCLSSTTTMTDSASGGTWACNPTSIATINSTTGVLRGNAAGGATISYTLPTGCRVTRTINVLNNVTPTASYTVSPTMPMCEGTRANITTSITNGGTTPIYQWIINGILVDTGRVYSYIPVNRDVVTLRVISNAACATPAIASATQTMSVTPTVTPHVSITASSGDTACTGMAVTFTANVINGGTSPAFRWWKNGLYIGATSSTFTYTPTNGDRLMVEMASNATCRAFSLDTGYFTIRVLNYATPTLTVSASPADTLCAGDHISLTANSTYPGLTPEYWWKVNGVTRGYGTYFNYIPNPGDSVKCYFASSYRCRLVDTLVVRRKLWVLPYILPTVSIHISPGTIVLPGTNANFTATVTNGSSSLSYQWYVNGYPVTGAILNYYVSNRLRDRDSVKCEVIDRGKCKNVTIWGYAIIRIGYNVGINDFSAQDAPLQLFPNPAHSACTVAFNATTQEETQITLFDVTGRTIKQLAWQLELGTNKKDIDLSGLSAGTYYITIRGASGSSKTLLLNVE